MRIVFDARVTTPELPGVARAAYGVLGGLAQLDHDFVINVLHRPQSEDELAALGLGEDPRFTLHRVDLPAAGLRPQQRLRGLATRLPHDTWHAPYPPRPLWGAGPAVVVANDLIVPDAGAPLSLRVARRRARWAVTTVASLRLAARVIVPSAATGRAVRRSLRIPASRIAVVPYAAAPGFRPHDASEVLHRYGLQPPYVMHLASNQPNKNTETLVRGWQRLSDYGADGNGAPAQLILAGHVDPSRPDPADVYAGIPGVRCLGTVPDADLPPLLAGAAAFAFPSLAEGFGLPALEAMASGTAVVAANRASIPEVVGEAGLLVEPTEEGVAEGLARVLRDESLRTDLERAGHERARRFTWARTAELTFAVHRALAAGGRR